MLPGGGNEGSGINRMRKTKVIPYADAKRHAVDLLRTHMYDLQCSTKRGTGPALIDTIFRKYGGQMSLDDKTGKAAISVKIGSPLAISLGFGLCVVCNERIGEKRTHPKFHFRIRAGQLKHYDEYICDRCFKDVKEIWQPIIKGFEDEDIERHRAYEIRRIEHERKNQIKLQKQKLDVMNQAIEYIRDEKLCDNTGDMNLLVQDLQEFIDDINYAWQVPNNGEDLLRQYQSSLERGKHHESPVKKCTSKSI